MEWVTSNGIYSGWFRNGKNLKTPVDEDIDLLERASKENSAMDVGEEKNFGNEVITAVSATSSITSSASSSVTPIQ